MFSTSKEKVNAAKDGMINEGGPSSDVADKETSHHFKSDAHDAASAVRDDVEGVARRTGQHARELADSAGHSLTGFGEAMTVRIRDNPVQSSAIALGIGAVIGMILKKR